MSGRSLVLLAAVLWSTSGFFMKSPVVAGMTPADQAGPLVALWRGVFCFVFLLPFARWRLLRPSWAMLGLVGSFALMSVCFITAMTRADAGDVIFLQYTAPFWVLLFNRFGLHEPTRRKDLVALAVAMAGVGVIVGFGSGLSDPVGLVLALIAGVGYGGVIVSFRFLHAEHSATLVCLCQFTTALVLLPWLAGGTLLLQGEQWLWIGALAVVQYALPYVLFARGLSQVGAQEASMLTLVEPVLNPIWVLLIWGTSIAAHTLLGGGLILLALVVRYAGRREQTST